MLFESIVVVVAFQTLFLITLYRHKRIKVKFDKLYSNPVLIFIISGLIAFNLLFFSLMMIDRSKSLYVINWIGNSKTITRPQLFELQGVSLGSKDFDYINLRINEQIQRGIVVENKGSLSLSVYGRILNRIANLFASAFLLKNWIAQKTTVSGTH